MAAFTKPNPVGSLQTQITFNLPGIRSQHTTPLHGIARLALVCFVNEDLKTVLASASDKSRQESPSLGCYPTRRIGRLTFHYLRATAMT